MQLNADKPTFPWRNCNIAVAFLNGRQRITGAGTPVRWNCFASLASNKKAVFFRYYFKQYVDDKTAERFFRKIKRWWFIGQVLRPSAKTIVENGYVTINLRRTTYFRALATLTLVRYIEEFAPLVQFVFANPTKKALLTEFITAHRYYYPLGKNASLIPEESWRPGLQMTDTGHALFSPETLNDRNKPLVEDDPHIIKEPPVESVEASWKKKSWYLTAVFLKSGVNNQ